MTSLLDAIIVGSLSGAVAAGIASWATPKRQHKFWVAQRHAEMCIDVIKRVDDIALDYIKDGGITPEFVRRRLACERDVRTLFSPDAYNLFMRFNDGYLVGTRPWMDDVSSIRNGSIANFLLIRNQVKLVMLSEVGIRRAHHTQSVCMRWFRRLAARCNK